MNRRLIRELKSSLALSLALALTLQSIPDIGNADSTPAAVTLAPAPAAASAATLVPPNKVQLVPVDPEFHYTWDGTNLSGSLPKFSALKNYPGSDDPPPAISGKNPYGGFHINASLTAFEIIILMLIVAVVIAGIVYLIRAVIRFGRRIQNMQTNNATNGDTSAFVRTNAGSGSGQSASYLQTDNANSDFAAYDGGRAMVADSHLPYIDSSAAAWRSMPSESGTPSDPETMYGRPGDGLAGIAWRVATAAVGTDKGNPALPEHSNPILWAWYRPGIGAPGTIHFLTGLPGAGQNGNPGPTLVRSYQANPGVNNISFTVSDGSLTPAEIAAKMANMQPTPLEDLVFQPWADIVSWGPGGLQPINPTAYNNPRATNALIGTK